MRATFGKEALGGKVYEQLLAKGYAWLKPRTLTVSVWIGNAADRQTYEDNLRAEVAAWEEQERSARSLTANQLAEPVMASALLETGGSMVSA